MYDQLKLCVTLTLKSLGLDHGLKLPLPCPQTHQWHYMGTNMAIQGYNIDNCSLAYSPTIKLKKIGKTQLIRLIF